MALTSETMSNPNDWLQFYNTLPLTQPPPSSHHDATLVSTVATPPTLNPSSSNNNNNSLSPEGRVSKPVRKRTRASRRTPTTLLNTDTANFRAMVQQFTGGPTTASFGAPSSSAASFGFTQGFVNSNPNANPMMLPHGYNTHQPSPYLLSLGNNNSEINQLGFAQRLMSSNSSSAIRPTTTMGISFASQRVQEGVPSGMVAGSVRPNCNASNENNGSNSFLY